MCKTFSFSSLHSYIHHSNLRAWWMNSDLLLVELLVNLHRLRLLWFCLYIYSYMCVYIYMCRYLSHDMCFNPFLKLSFAKGCSCMYLNIYCMSVWFWSSYLYFHYLIGKWNGILLCGLVNVQIFHFFKNWVLPTQVLKTCRGRKM